MASIVLKNVWKRYGDLDIVKNFNIEIPDKSFCILVGPSGCGKTTTLRMVSGLEEVSDGEIYIDGVKVNDIPPKNRDIAMVFQSYALYPHMTVYDNMAFGLKLRGFSKKEIQKRVNEAAEILGIGHLLDRRPKQLSGGQRQRVAVGRAIVRKPKVFLFDEPLSNLDAKLRGQMRTELKKIHAKLQSTMIYVTHDQTEAMTMGDRICVMKEGIIQQIAGPIELYDNPANKFVAGFIGSPAMNFFDVEIINKNGALYLNEGAFEIVVPNELKSKVAPYVGQKLTVGIRPEDIFDKLFYNRPDKDVNSFSATVEVVEPLGSEIYLHLNTGKNEFVAKVDSQNRAKPNQVIELVFNIAKTHLFDSKTGVKII
ncbi:ABC transporter ATP-binding protein [Endomicrobium proavitum]|uniref:Putative sugar transporter subunit: ATP-binding component of ABC superfamily transporter n=1 Tax=Endomicrobium proavitum TaxID=1408281 RepID=A0A0G3WI40_9BACT|nr:sn-glycerol-3-phosphate ABC transporter ATP-binding protein UgpC [Endomicrobium proavitum]AKL97532.1 putative sugar transporter subunit: ATP-binding component of ABC superfamily transporter [Endomicrobium proavitum]